MRRGGDSGEELIYEKTCSVEEMYAAGGEKNTFAPRRKKKKEKKKRGEARGRQGVVTAWNLTERGH